MKILIEHLREHIDLPSSTRDIRELLDDTGIEVKTADTNEYGTVFNVELLANRGDHYAYGGIAREVSGRTGAPLKYPRVRKLETQPGDATRIRIETPLCLVYTLTELFAPENGNNALPREIVAPMLAADMHSTLPPVDASNVTNLDLGQPTHAFDADKIEGPITVRTSRRGEKAWMLFTPEPVEIPEGTLVIADDAKILGIAGVIGCEESAVREGTKRILLESATFDPVAIRIASRQLNQATDAAARFMRGGDPSLPVIGAARVAYLLEEHCGYRVGNCHTAGEWKNPNRVIDVDVARTQRFIGAPLTALEMAERLTRYGFAVEPGDDTLRVTVPPHRLWDVVFEADIQEELLKSVGYNNTVVTLPHVSMGALPSHAENVIARTSELLVAEGFYEIFTDSFYGRGMRERLGLTEGDALWPHVETQNSIEKNYSLLRNTTVGQALDALATNINLKNAAVKMYEWARVFLPDANAENGVCNEQATLWALANGRDRGPFWADKGRPADAIYLKGLIEQLRLELRVDLRTGSASEHRLAQFFHPGRCAGIWLDGRVVGIFGELHPLLLQRFDIKRQRPVYLEIEAPALFTTPIPRVYAEPPTRQAVVRNVAYAIPSGVTAAEVRDALASRGPAFLREIRIVDHFELPAARAITFEIEYLSEEALTGETINAATEGMMAAVAEKFGERVTLRA
ncbi:MAG: phenylalanine--tRNA ligase subunit beta [Acidobacteriota bacterium]|nr:phenylalanine--tRNA ligase subunit beta [Acidobacteriota bacterium]